MRIEMPDSPAGTPEPALAESPSVPEPVEGSPSFEFSPPAAAAQHGTPQRPGAGPMSASRDSPLRASCSPTEARALKAAARRAAAADFIAAQTGIQVPHESDFLFRQALRDGVALCRLLNALRPGTIGKVIDHSAAECSSPTGDVIRTFENVANFIHASQQLTGVDTALLSAADLEDVGDRPQVAEAVLSLQAWAAAQAAEAAGLRSSASWPRPPSPAGLGHATPPPPLRTPASPRCGVAPPPSPAGGEFSFTPHAAAAVHRAGGAQRQDGLEYLMRTCNHMLKSSMGMPATPLPPPPRAAGGLPPEIALDAVGPVLETVLQNLTAEYEKRLLAKDQEFKLGQEAQERMRRDIARLKQEVQHWKEQAANVQYLPAPESEEARAKFEAELEATRAEAEARQAAAAAEVARKEAELAQVQQAAAAKVAEAEEQLGVLSEEVQQYRHLNERYRQISEENRQLYNTVQDLRGAIRVYCRVRPRGKTGDASASMVELGEEGQLQVFSQKHSKWHAFRFDKVFGEESTQDEVYAETQPLIRSVLDGYNVCIFAYGQTGSGKTHTMSGTDIGQYAGRGINFRALDDLFELNRLRQAEVEYSISVQLLEIYNEAIRDLLVPDDQARAQRSLSIKNLERSGFNVPDAIQVPVRCTEDVLEVMERGARNRAVAETRMNDRSSRSHQVLTVMVEGTSKVTHARTHGCLHLIDLAGSERVSRSGAEGQQLLEAQHINKSLSALGNVMHALASKSAHIPFRDSKLTQLLQDSLSGQAKTMMFMHVAPEMTSVSETLSTLNFGKAVTEVTLGAAKKNAESGTAWEAKERALKSERENQDIKRALAAEQQKSADLQAQLDALRAQLARAASSPGGGSGSEDEGTIRAYRPAATRAAPGLGTAGSGGLTPRSRLAQQSGAAPPAGRVTPVGAPAAGGSKGLTPRSSGGGITPRGGSVSARPPQVARLNLGGSGAKAEPLQRRLSGGGGGGGAPAAPGVRPPMAKLNLAQLQRPGGTEGEENRTPLSARVSAAAQAGAGGAATPRSARRTSPGSSTNWLVDASDSEAEEAGGSSPDCSPAGVAAAPVWPAEGAQEQQAFQIAMSPPRPLSSRGPPPPAAQRPPAVPRLGLAGLAAGAANPGGGAQQPQQQLPAARAGAAAALATAGRRLSQAGGSRIPVPSPSPPSAAAQRAASGSLTARPSTQQRSPPLGTGIPRGPMSARESPAQAAARRAALQQRAASSVGAGAAGMRRAASGSSEVSSNGSLSSARGVRSSQIGAGTSRRWA